MLASPIRFEIEFLRWLLLTTFVKSRVGDASGNHVPGSVLTSDVRRQLVTPVRIIALDSSGCDIRRVVVAGSRIRGWAVRARASRARNNSLAGRTSRTLCPT